MTSREDPSHYLAQLARQSAAAWHALGAQTFPGELSIATDNSVYRFKNGMFLGRAKSQARSFECPKAMRGSRLIGFLHDEGGLWSLSPRWRKGSHAVLWKPSAETTGEGSELRAFVLTSATTSFTLEEPEPKPQPDPSEPIPSPWVARPPSQSGVMIRRGARPPSIRQPLPPSMTRIHSAAPAPATP